MPTFGYNSNTKDGKPFKNWPFSEKRNVVLTDFGWTRRIKKGTRTIDELLVAARAPTVNVASLIPFVTEVFVDKNAYTTGATGTLYVVFSEPMKFNTNSGGIRLTIANTVAGAPIAAFTAAPNSTVLSVADNVLALGFTAAVAGTYSVAAQNLTNSGANAVNFTSQNVDNAAMNVAIISVNLGANTTFTVV
jgi:hypothetical protein